MARNFQRLNFSKTLNQDVSPENLDSEEYVDALDVQALTNNTESTTSHIPIIGDEYAFDLGSVVVQNKTWRITTPQDAVNIVGGLFLYDQNGNLFPTINGQAQPMTWNRNQTVALQRTAILTMFSTIDGSGNTVITAGTDYLDITTDTINGYDIGLLATTHTVTPTVSTTSLNPQIIAESHDITLTGENNDIAGKDLLGDLYILSTPQTNLPTTITPTITTVTIVAASAPVNFQYRITTSSAHGLSTGMKIITSGINVTTPGIVSPNGIWIITVISSTSFNLTEWYNTTTGFVQGAAGGNITLYTEGIGEIGVGQKNINTGVWTYTRLLRTKEWNFRTKKQADFRMAERTTIKDSLYWTNNYEPPRAFYYNRPLNGIFVNSAWNGTIGDLDGAIEQINPNGHYSYLTVGQETKLLLSSSGAELVFISQSQAGGQIPSGNSRYAFRFLSDSLSPTEWSDLSNPINAYLADRDGNPRFIIGDAPHVTTGKINNFTISGIVPGLFKYVELAFVNYVGTAIEGFIIKRIILDGVSSTINISHTGTETGMTDLDLGGLNFKQTPIETARNMNVQDKRMILSDITLSQQKDFTAWAQTITYSLKRQSLTAVRSAVNGTLVMGEFQSPTNVNMFMGYMINETYRLGVKGRYRSNGFWSDAFWVDDITINCSSGGRKLAGLADFNLTANTAGGADDIAYIPYIEFVINGTILDYLIDGIKIRDLFDAISFVRAEVVPTILANGVGVVGVQGDSYESGFDAAGAATNYQVIGVPVYIIEYPWASGRTGGGAMVLPSNPKYPASAAPDAFVAKRRYAAFYSPDVTFGHTSISFESGDKIINHGNQAWYIFDNSYNSDLKRAYSNNGEYTGRSNKNAAFPPVNVTLLNAPTIQKGGFFSFGAESFYKSTPILELPFVAAGACDNPTGMVFNSATDFNNVPGDVGVFGFTPDDYGIYYMQYYRALADQYGDKTLTQYVSTGHILEINANTLSSNEAVFGGDTFTQLSYFKHRFPDTIHSGLAGGLSFYSQNRINAQMRQKSLSQIGNLYPAISTVTWLESTSNTDGNQGEAYQEGYTIRNEVQSDITFDPNVDQINDLPASIFYSPVKILDSQQDNYRIILPLNRHDLDITDGSITHHETFNGELITWQKLKLQSQFFNSRGVLQTSATAIVVGDGAVMSRDGITITNYGCSHKWSILIGRSIGGNDTAYWIDIISKRVFRLAADGTISISEINGMKSFFANNLRWVVGKDTPADGDGICGVWQDRFSQAIWTIRGHMVTNDYASGTTYESGNVVFYRPVNFSTFEKTGELFISKLNTNTGHAPAVYTESLVITSITNVSPTLTVTTASAHYLVTGDIVTFSGVLGLTTTPDIGLPFAVTVTGANTFTITVSIANGTYTGSSGIISDFNPKWWELVLHSDNNYYNEYSIIYNEDKKGFTCFLTPKPKIYNKWQDSYLTPRPISHVSKIYEANAGTELTWYTESAISQTADGFIEGVINKTNEQQKTFISIDIDSDAVPARMEFNTKLQETYLLSSEFEQNDESFYSDIKEDSTVTVTNPLGLNSLDTGLMSGKYLKAKFFFAVAVYNRLVNLIINYVPHFPKKGT